MTDQHTPEGPPPEEVTASTLSILAVGKASSSLDRFGSWLFGGFAAGFSLLITNRKAVCLAPEDLGTLGIAFVAIGILAVIAKYSGMLVSAAVEAARETLEVGGMLPGGDAEKVLRAMEAAVARPAKYLAAWRIRRMRSEFLSGARDLSIVVQLQGFVVLVEAAVVIGSAVWLLKEISG